MSLEGRAFKNGRDYSKWESHFLSLAAFPEGWSRLDSVSDDYRSDWRVFLSPRRVLDTSSVGGVRLYCRRLSRGLGLGGGPGGAGQGGRGGGGGPGAYG